MKKPRFLVVDDDPAVLRSCGQILRGLGDTVVVLEQSAPAAAALLEQERFDVILTDLRMPGMDGLEILRRARRIDAEQIVVILTGFPTLELAVEGFKLGATDFVTKPVDGDELLVKLRRLLHERKLLQENLLLDRQAARGYEVAELVTMGPAMQSIRATLAKLARADVDVLITGETGVGKELVARSLHRQSARSRSRFVPVDCGAIPEALMESELFGHERGAYTGADNARMGLLEFADQGTLFLDELGELPLALQPKLLRSLQERRVRRIGGTEEIPVDIRIVAATNRDLAAMVGDKRFREDLLYRVKVARIDIPPLRERPEDIPVLVMHFAHAARARTVEDRIQVHEDAMELLVRYGWPGNVRELQNVMRYAAAMSAGETILPSHLPDEVALPSSPATGPVAAGGFFEIRAAHVARFERAYLERLMESHRGDTAMAAREAVLPRGTLYRLLNKYGLLPESFRK